MDAGALVATAAAAAVTAAAAKVNTVNMIILPVFVTQISAVMEAVGLLAALAATE